jgi:hypothetical protein
MAVKVFCNACHRFIKEANRNEIKTLTGEEICQNCETTVHNLFADVGKVAQRGIVQLEKKRDDIKAEMDSLRKKVIKGDE